MPATYAPRRLMLATDTVSVVDPAEDSRTIMTVADVVATYGVTDLAALLAMPLLGCVVLRTRNAVGRTVEVYR